MMGHNAVGSGKSVLISDDDEFFRVALSSVLKDRLDFAQVVETTSFDSAVDVLAGRDDLDLALFDLNMPGMNNWENLREVREFYPAVRIAVVSGSQSRDDILMAISIGLHGYINKGLGISEMTRALVLICEGTVYLPPFLPDLSLAKGNVSQPSDPPPLKQPHPDTKADITPRQLEVLELLIEGKSNKAMARALKLSEGTIKFHLSAIFRQLRATNRVEAATAGAQLLARMHR